MKKWIVLVLCFAFAKANSQEISPQTELIDILSIKGQIRSIKENIFPRPLDWTSIEGNIRVEFKALANTHIMRLDAKNMWVKDLSDSYQISSTTNHVEIRGEYRKDSVYEAFFAFRATPKQTFYQVDNGGNNQIWTQGQGKYTSYWLPTIDDMNDKIKFQIVVVSGSAPNVILSGLQKNEKIHGGLMVYSSRMTRPISSYLLALVIGDYNVKKETSTSGVPLEYYYYPQDSLKVEPTYRYSKQIFDFLETEIGVPYPWQVYKQVPVKDFLYAGMENASCTIFSDDFMVDAIGFNDRNYVNVNAHELAHQWFGDMVTETKSDHHWLHEGFATYYALLAEREIFGDDYFYYKLFESAEQLRELSDQGKGQQLVTSGGSSLTYYQKGAWAVHILRELVGEEAFTKAVRTYLLKHAYQNVTTDDFMKEVQAVTSINLEEFSQNWLYQKAFQAEDALQSLTKSDFMKQYFELQSLRLQPLSAKFEALTQAIDSGNEYLGQEGVYQLTGEPIVSVLPAYKKALATNNIFVRQAIATSIEQLPKPLVPDFYTLLEDESYVTREQALIKLWVYHQQQNDVKSQQALLDKMDKQQGFADGNIRTLWLTLSLATPDYKTGESYDRYQELISYTDPKQPFQLRKNAFQYLQQLNSFESQSLRNLIEACVHHTWRFRESARNLLKELLQDTAIRDKINSWRSSLPEKQQAYLEKVL